MIMSAWYSKNLGSAMLSFEAQEQLESSFLSEAIRSGNQDSLALFKRHESEGRLHCEVVAYFSHASEKIAKALGAKPCKTPSPNGLNPLIGAEETWLMLFPDYINR